MSSKYEKCFEKGLRICGELLLQLVPRYYHMMLLV